MFGTRKEQSVAITTTCPLRIRDQARLKGIKMRFLLIRGWESLQNETPFQERINELESTISKYQSRLSHQNTRIFQLEREIEAKK